MIKLLENDRKKDFLSFCNRSINGAVIFTRFLTYGNCREALFWYSEDDNGSINGVYSLMDGIFTYDAEKTADEEEILMFASVMGAREITEKGRYTLKFTGNGKHCDADDITGENLRLIFPVIYEDNENRDSFFVDWYTDISHKIRHGFIHGKGVFQDGKCVSVALTSGESDEIAVISSVATLRSHRKLGHGENAVISLAKSIDKKIYLMTDNEQTAQWYKKIGFTEI